MHKNRDKNVIILGAGPAGLALAYEIIEKSNFKPIIIEKLAQVGGLSRTVYFDNMGVDIGGHRLYTKDEYVKNIWLKFLPIQNKPSIDDIVSNRETNYKEEEIEQNPNKKDDVMLIRRRFSSIIYNKKFFDYPIKLNPQTIKKLGFFTSIQAGFSYLKSILIKRKEESLEDFMINRFGLKLYQIFFKDYTKKVWGYDASVLSSEWGQERIRQLSLFKTIVNAILSNFKFIKHKKETSLIDEFYYPKFGCSQLWDLMAQYIIENGGEIIKEAKFSDFTIQENNIISVKYNSNNEIKEINANFVASSIPIKELIKAVDAPLDIKQNALNLPYRDYILVSFYTDNFNLKNETNYKTPNNITPNNWIYLQEKDAIASRIQIMNNWSPYLVKDFENKYLISLEYFTNKDDELWNLKDSEIIDLAIKECEKYGLFDKENVIKSFVVREEKAYPTYCGTYKNIEKIKESISKTKNLYLIGRNGQHKYNNMDEAMISGIEVARKIIKAGNNG